jgi:23S rRNA pseudouridine1911/1915/1917 synthase
MTTPAESATSPLRIEITPSEAGIRLDRLLATRLTAPRNQVQQWIADGRVRADGKPLLRPSTTLAAGAVLEVEVPVVDHGADLVPEAGALPLLWVDEHLVVLDKPAGLVVHPGAGVREGTLVHRLLAHFPELAEVGGPGRPGIVHRLDRDTTGVLVVARTAVAYQALVRAFAARAVDKTYLAIVWGVPKEPRGRIEAAIGRHPNRRTEMTVLASGRPAVTSWRRVATAESVSLLALGLETGRTHQIRVHARAIGHPLVGDPVYGEARWRQRPSGGGSPRSASRLAALRDFARPALHAWRIACTHPVSGERLHFASPPPADLRALWTAASDQPWPEDRLSELPEPV